MIKKYLLSILFILFSVSITTFAAAASPALKFNLDATTGQATITPDLIAGTPYNYHAYQAADGSLLLGLTWVEGNRAKLAFYALPFKYSGEPLPVPGPTPNPNPGPNPNPNPGPNPPTPPTPPTPAAQKCFFITIYESAETTQDFALCQVSPKIRDYCKAGGHQTFFLDKDAKGPDGQPPKGYAKWLLMAVGKPLPYTIVADAATGEKVLNGDGKGESAPANEESMLKYFQKFGGVSPSASLPIPTVTRPGRSCVNGGCQ